MECSNVVVSCSRVLDRIKVIYGAYYFSHLVARAVKMREIG